jgi:hypothetical protein
MGRKSAAAKMAGTLGREDTSVDETDVGAVEAPSPPIAEPAKDLSFLEAPVAFIWNHIPFRWELLSFVVCLTTR